MNQLQIHKKIDEFITAGPTGASVEVAKGFVQSNEDSKRYLFSKANELWLKWFFDNGLFEELKKKVDDPNKFGYHLSELEYLTRMAEKMPELVGEIILSTPISKDTFNPEVIDRFFWITGLLPVPQIKRILQKMYLDNWLKLMARFSRSGYEYKKMAEKFAEVKDYEAIYDLAKIVLTVRDKEEFANIERFSISDKLFYLGDVSETGVFEFILDPNNPDKEKFLKLLSEVLIKITDIGVEKDGIVFEKSEPFYLLDASVFTLQLDTDKRSHFREDIQNFIATIKTLIESTLNGRCENVTEVRRIYSENIAVLPDTLTSWRLKLYAITRCPEAFKSEIKEFLFRVFNVGECYFEIDTGAEYHQGLMAGFSALDEDTDQREYVENVIKYYGAKLDDADKEKWRKRDGLEILTYIKKYLKPEEITKAESVFGTLLEEGQITPHPTVMGGMGGIVNHKAPFNPSEMTIDALVEHLKTDASPAALKEQYKNDDFLSPRGPEGLGDAIKEDFKARKADYLQNLNKFFDRGIISPNYVYSILRQVEDSLRAKESFTDEQFVQVINFFDLIRESGEKDEFKPMEERVYLADWITVHKSMADVFLEVLAVIKDSKTFKDNQIRIFSIIKYLLTIKSSPDTEDDKRESNELAHVAINSVRGQAYRAFVQFAYNESNKILSNEVKALFEHILDTETSNAVRFTLGQFLASFYFRDILFVKGLLPKIFPKESGKGKLYFATWEGYLASSLYKELFDELRGYYEYAIKLNRNIYPDRKYLKGLDETLAVHLALAYAHFDFNIADPLFDLFWKTPSEARHYEFVSFIGRSCITRSQAGDAWFKENNVSKDKLIEFWNWIISTDIPIEPKAFSGFGFWINPDIEIIDEKIIIKNLATSLKKSKGDIDWDYGLTRRLKIFATIDPDSTLGIIKQYLLNEDELNTNRRAPLFSIDGEIKEALEIIYKNPSFKTKVEDLVNILIEKGSSMFWGLKDVLK
jgi:hypothetical protein